MSTCELYNKIVNGLDGLFSRDKMVRAVGAYAEATSEITCLINQLIDGDDWEHTMVAYHNGKKVLRVSIGKLMYYVNTFDSFDELPHWAMTKIIGHGSVMLALATVRNTNWATTTIDGDEPGHLIMKAIMKSTAALGEFMLTNGIVSLYETFAYSVAYDGDIVNVTVVEYGSPIAKFTIFEGDVIAERIDTTDAVSRICDIFDESIRNVVG